MLVVLTDEQVLSAGQVCHNCLMADSSGQPRWRRGKLGCGHLLEPLKENQPIVYQCQMGFKITNVE